jgi:hypothetical protein
MTPEQLEQAVIKLIDDNVDNYSTEIYADFLGTIIGNLEMREESARRELEDN